jgi:branched-chain amino acid transport system substrate-binding protein
MGAWGEVRGRQSVLAAAAQVGANTGGCEVKLGGWRANAIGLLAAVATVTLGLSSIAGAASSAPGVTSKTITIGYITSLTGFASSTFADGAEGAMARIDQQNAAGGVDGRKLKLVVKDDASSLTTDATDASELGGSTFGIVDFSSFTFAGAPALQKAGVPVTGEEFDGPEWGEQPYTNMFSDGPPNDTEFGGKFYTSTDIGNFMKSIGITKLANLAYGISPSATQAAVSAADAAGLAGVANPDCYNDYNVQFGSTDFTPDALAIKQSGCNGVEAPMVDTSDVALAGALQQGGSASVKQIYYTGYSQDVLSGEANTEFQNAYISAGINFTTPNAATKLMLNAFRKYIPGYTGGIPDLGLFGSYLGTDLMIKGLELAGKNPTRQGFISSLRKVTNYTANGILPAISFNHFGTVAMFPKTSCTYMMQLKGKRFVVANGGKEICGKLVPVSS